MQADVFNDLCKSTWEHYPENFPHETREIARLFNPKSVRDVPQMGAFAVIFTDGSVAICGNRGSSVIATFVADEHSERGEDTSAVVNTVEIDLDSLQPETLANLASGIGEAIDNLYDDQGNVAPLVHNHLQRSFERLCDFLRISQGNDFVSDHVRCPVHL